MSIFGSIKDAIFGHKTAAAAGPTPATQHPPAAAPGGAPAPAAQSSAAPAQQVDIAAVMDSLSAQSLEKLNWKTSIVDLMKLLGLDSSLAARKQLADEIGYTGPKDGSAEMNIALHKAVMKKLADNGGIVPPDLKD